MVMSTAADWLDVEDDADPDTLKVPENPDHRRIVDAIGIVAARQLRPNTVVYLCAPSAPNPDSTCHPFSKRTELAGFPVPREPSETIRRGSLLWWRD
jgi:hypothetical protein